MKEVVEIAVPKDASPERAKAIAKTLNQSSTLKKQVAEQKKVAEKVIEEAHSESETIQADSQVSDTTEQLFRFELTHPTSDRKLTLRSAVPRRSSLDFLCLTQVIGAPLIESTRR